MTDDAELATDAPEVADLFARIPAHYVETAKAIALDDSRRAVSLALLDLLAAGNAQLQRQIAEGQAELRALRRARFHLVSDPQKLDLGA